MASRPIRERKNSAVTKPMSHKKRLMGTEQPPAISSHLFDPGFHAFYRMLQHYVEVVLWFNVYLILILASFSYLHRRDLIIAKDITNQLLCRFIVCACYEFCLIRCVLLFRG